MRRFIIIIICLALGFSSNALAVDQALIIGVGDYKVDDADLPGIDHDVAVMKKVADMLGFKQITTLLDEQASYSAINQALDALAKSAGQNDRVLLYFSGHGSQIPDENGDEQDKADEVLLPYDIGIDEQKHTLFNAWIDDELGRKLKQIKAKIVLVLIDSCHSGTATKRVKSLDLFKSIKENKDLKPKFFTYKGMPRVAGRGSIMVEGDQESAAAPANNIISLVAAQDDEKAVATPDGSLFTQALLDSITRAVSQKTSLTLKDLRVSTTDFILSSAEGQEKPHHPFLYGNMALAKVNLFEGVRTSSPTPPAKDWWEEIKKLAMAAGTKIEIETNQKVYQSSDLMVISFTAPSDGYVMVLNLEKGYKRPTVLFPNKYHEESRVASGDRIKLPTKGHKYRFRIKSPPGGQVENMVAVFVTESKNNAFLDGYGSKDAAFKEFSDKSLFILKSTGGFAVEEKATQRPYAAGIFITTIKSNK